MKKLIILILLIILIAGPVFCQGGGPPGPAPSPIGDNYGYLSNPGCEFTLMMRDTRGSRFRIESKGKRIKLPLGGYSVEMIQLRKPDKQGREWSISTRYLENPIPVEIKKGKTLQANFGEPFNATVTRSGESFHFSLRGNRGEEYTYFSVKGEDIQPPSLTIIDPSGKVIESGKFEFG